MTEPRRQQPPHEPRRARVLDATNLCLLLAAVLATLPWLFAPNSGPQTAAGSAAKAVSAPTISVATNNGVAT
jgi:hypothetical protein